MTNPLPSNDIIERIQKLWRLSESSNENETAVAMSMATKLMQQYNLDHSDINGYESASSNPLERDQLDIGGQTGFSARSVWFAQICDTVAGASFCKVLYRSKGISILGRTREVQIVKYMLSSLFTRLLILANERTSVYADEYKERTGRSAYRQAYGSDNAIAYRNSWLLGASWAICSRIRDEQKQFKEQSAKSTALVLVRETEVDNYISELYPKLKTFESKVGRINGNGYRAGENDGRSITIASGAVESKSSTLSLKAGK